jgi:hypothetical protein
VKKVSIVLMLSALAVGVPKPVHAAANPTQASCIGVGAPSVPPGTKDDVALFINFLAGLEGTTHGALVGEFVHQKGDCVTLPPVPPHP